MTPGRAMGTFAEDAAREYQFTRGAQDEYAIESLRRANEAIQSRRVRARDRRRSTVKTRKGEDDRRHATSSPARPIPRRSPASSPPSPRTARSPPPTPQQHHRRRRGAGASPAQSVADRLGLKPVARIVAHAAHAHEPAKFTTAPVPAVRKALEQGRLERRRRRPVRGQRGLRLRRDDRDARPRHPARQAQRPRRRHGARPPDRRQRRAHPGDLAVARWRPTARSAASPPSASAAAKRPRWRWSWSTDRHGSRNAGAMLRAHPHPR